jgi:RNA polymerase sigma-70 factor, ECF subfamily
VTSQVREAVEATYKEEWGRIVATLIRITGDWDLAEECAADAFAVAVERWERDGVPDKPGAWLTTTARNRALDLLRREKVGAAKLREVAVLESRSAADDAGGAGSTGSASGAGDESGVPDDRLRLMFTCCHPALSLETRVALTLRTLAGLSTASIARAFLVGETTMAKRLVRAKQKIQHAGIPYRVPPADLLPSRLPGVLGVLYLLFNEGYSAPAVPPVDLTAEAIRLARVLAALMPAEPEAAGLLALMLLQDSRRAARVSPGGDLIPLEEQDRSRWDTLFIQEGLQVLETALLAGAPGPYQIQASIAACHASARAPEETDWPQITLLYGELYRYLPTPVVALNRAVAVGMADGPAAGLALTEPLRDQLPGYYLLSATRADLLRRAGAFRQAAQAYQEALDLAPTEAEQRFFRRRLSETSGLSG